MENKIKFDNTDWIEHDTYYMNKHEQGTQKWFEAREKGMSQNTKYSLLTASNFGVAIGVNDWETPSDLAYRLITGKKKQFSQKSITAMKHGNDNEEFARQRYMKFGYKDSFSDDINYKPSHIPPQVITGGFCVPKWDVRIGYSPDGIVGDDGLIEIKSPQEVKDYMLNKRLSVEERVTPTYYAQMQGGMAIMGRKWCDFIVDIPHQNIHIVERVYFNKDYWDNKLYKGICEFLDNTLPQLEKLLQILNFN